MNQNKLRGNAVAENTKIEWCNHTFNAWRGCEQVSPACDNCYAMRMARRNPKLLGKWGSLEQGGTRILASPEQWKTLKRWNDRAEKKGVRELVFVNSISDVFEDWQGPMHFGNGRDVNRCEYCDNLVEGDESPCCNRTTVMATMQDVRQLLWSHIGYCENLTFLLLTKRPQNIWRMVPAWWNHGWPQNVWMGTTVENQEQRDARLPYLDELRREAGLRVAFASCAPLLEDVVFRGMQDRKSYNWLGEGGINWVIAGGESGPGARPSHPEWFRSLRDQCQSAEVPFFFKEWGEFHTRSVLDGEPVFRAFRSHQHWINKAPTWVQGGVCLDAVGNTCRNGKDFKSAVFPVTIMDKVGKKTAGRLLDGREWNEFPPKDEG